MTRVLSSLFVMLCALYSIGGGEGCMSVVGVGFRYQSVRESPRLSGPSSYSDGALSGGSFSSPYAPAVGSESEMEGVGIHLTLSWCCFCTWCCAFTLALASSSDSCWNSLSNLSCSSKSSLISSWLSPSCLAGESGLTKYWSVMWLCKPDW